MRTQLESIAVFFIFGNVIIGMRLFLSVCMNEVINYIRTYLPCLHLFVVPIN